MLLPVQWSSLEVKMIKMMGFDGKSLVNPRQIDIVHKIFTPSQKEIMFAEKVVREIEEKKALGIGVFLTPHFTNASWIFSTNSEP